MRCIFSLGSRSCKDEMHFGTLPTVGISPSTVSTSIDTAGAVGALRGELNSNEERERFRTRPTLGLDPPEDAERASPPARGLVRRSKFDIRGGREPPAVTPLWKGRKKHCDVVIDKNNVIGTCLFRFRYSDAQINRYTGVQGKHKRAENRSS